MASGGGQKTPNFLSHRKKQVVSPHHGLMLGPLAITSPLFNVPTDTLKHKNKIDLNTMTKLWTGILAPHGVGHDIYGMDEKIILKLGREL